MKPSGVRGEIERRVIEPIEEAVDAVQASGARVTPTAGDAVWGAVGRPVQFERPHSMDRHGLRLGWPRTW